jgi:dihydroorotate dehydrogenase electron transfer subunit
MLIKLTKRQSVTFGMDMIEQVIKLEFNKRVATDTFFMGFKCPEIAARSRPGQFIMLRVSQGMEPLLRRPFSICGIQGKDLICILYRVVGRGTAILSKKGDGEILSVIGPLGRGFELPERDNKVLMVAGGIGVAPIFFLAQVLKRRDMEFMTGFKSSSEIIEAGQVGDPSIRMSVATDDGTAGYAGTVTDLLNVYLDRNPNRSYYLYACGPLQMLKSVVSIAIDREIPCQVSMESAMACGLGACQGCGVKAFSREREIHYHYVCKDGPVFPAHLIDWKSI